MSKSMTNDSAKCQCYNNILIKIIIMHLIINDNTIIIYYVHFLFFLLAVLLISVMAYLKKK